MLIEAIGDQKRLVRGMHWWRARYFLRVRDGVHNRPWKLLTIAGPAPMEEVRCIKEIMPRAHITAVDIKEENVLKAIDAGVDDAYCMDVGAITKVPYTDKPAYSTNMKSVLPEPFSDLQGDNKFDAICIDLTGPADDWLKAVVNTYFMNALQPRGVMIVTFSYGRDVVELLNETWRLALNKEPRAYSAWEKDNPTAHLNQLPDQVVTRAWYVLRSLSRQLDSCLQYRGHAMPMVSCLLVKKASLPEAMFTTIEKGDYELACGAEDLGNVFACPVERLVHLRQGANRRLAARKAVATRMKRLRGKSNGNIINMRGEELDENVLRAQRLLQGPSDEAS